MSPFSRSSGAEPRRVFGAAPLTFEGVFVEHAPFVWRTLRRLGAAPADIEDLCQDVFMVVHRQLPSFEGRSSVRTWVYGICVRVASDYRKRLRRRREDVVEEVPEQEVPAEQPEVVRERQARALLDAALAKLDEDKRAVFVLYELEELPMAEVAQAVGCPVQTAYARLYAARRLVETALRRVTGEGGIEA